MALLENEELAGVDVEEDTKDWQFVQLGKQQNFGINTAGLEDKDVPGSRGLNACKKRGVSFYLSF